MSESDTVQAGEINPKDFSELLKEQMNMKMPRVVIRRVNALRNIQKEKLEHDQKFFEELNQLELKYAALNEPLLALRSKLISGEYEPTESEGTWYLDENKDEKDKKALGDITNAKKDADETLIADLKNKTEETKDVKGIPDFWLHVMQSCGLIGEMVTENDVPALQHLRDVRVKLDKETPYTYTLEFHFDENEYFTNTLLTKTYDMSIALDPKDPFNFDGPEIYKCTGCTINWKEGKDLTTRLMKTKQKSKTTGNTRVINKEEKLDSFFNFFNLPTADGIKPSYKRSMMTTDADKQVAIVKKKKEGDDEGVDVDEEEEAENLDEELCDADFEIGHYFKEFLIPRAGLFFTGDINDPDDDEEEDDDEDDDEDEDDEDDDDEDSEEEEDEEDDDEEEEEDGEKKVLNKKTDKKAPKDAQNKQNECKQN